MTVTPACRMWKQGDQTFQVILSQSRVGRQPELFETQYKKKNKKPGAGDFALGVKCLALEA